MRQCVWVATVCLAISASIVQPIWSQAEDGLELKRVVINDNSAITDNSWVTVVVEVANGTDRDADVVVATSLEERPFDQYGRHFWVPARATRMNWFPLHVADMETPIRHLSGASFDPETDQITLTEHPLANGELVRFSNPTGELPAGLEDATDHYVINREANSFQVSIRKNGRVVDFVTAGSGPISVDWTPVRFQKTFRTYLFDRTSGQDVAVKTNTGVMYRENPLTVVDSRVSTGLIFDLSETMEIDSPYEAVLAMRAGQNLDRVTLQFQTAWMPRIEENLLVYDQLVIAEQGIANYPAGVTAIRRWIQSGGVCWIMLDRVGVDLARQLIGSEVDLELVESVPLTELKLERKSSNPRVENQIVAEREFEIPITMDRVLTSNVEVDFEVDGWPAAFWAQVGNGRVLVTTLGSKGWLRSRQLGDDRGSDEEDAQIQDTYFYGIEAFNQLGVKFFADSQPKQIDKTLLARIHQDQIGFQITRRSTVLVIFSTFILALLAIGLALAKRGRLDWMVYVTPAVSIVIAAVVLLLGIFSRAGVEKSFAETQLISVEAGGEEYTMTGLSTVLNESGSSTEISSRLGGQFYRDAAISTGKNQRWLWSDAENWRIEQSELPSGINQVEFRQSSDLPQSVAANVSFNENGLSGRIDTSLLTNMEDAVFLTNSGFVPVILGSDGRFELDEAELNAGKQFIASSLISDEHRRHREMYESLYLGTGALQNLINPRLAFWSNGLDSGFDFDGVQHSAARGLYLVPVKFTKLQGAKKIRIPDVLLPYDSVQKLDGKPKSTVYDGDKDEWHELPQAVDAMLRIQLPREALPLQVESLKMLIDINAPSMKMSVFGYQDQTEVLQREISGPDGKYELTISDPNLLLQDDDGGLLVGLKVTSQETFLQISQSWRIRDIYFQVQGTTAPEE